MSPEDNATTSSSGTDVNSSPLQDVDISTGNDNTDIVSEEVERIRNINQFIVENLYPEEEGEVSAPAQMSDTPEISEEEKSSLFFAPDYEPTPEEVAQRRENIEKSEYEFKPIGEATPENNVVLATLKQKEESKAQKSQEKGIESKPSIVQKFQDLVDRVETTKILKRQGFSKDESKELIATFKKECPDVNPRSVIHDIGNTAKTLIEHFETNDENSRHLSKSEIFGVTVKAYSRMKDLVSPQNYYPGIRSRDISLDNSEEFFNFQLESNPRLIEPQDLIDIATCSDEKWDELRNNLSKIPHLTRSSLSMHGMVGILNRGFTDSQKEQLDSIKNGLFVEKKEATFVTDPFWDKSRKGNPEEDLHQFIFNLTRGDQGVQENNKDQNMRACKTYGGSVSHNKEEQIKQDLQYLRYGLQPRDIHSSGGENLYSEVEIYLSSTETKQSEKSKSIDKDKISVVKSLIESEIDVDSAKKIFEWVTNPENYDVIKRINRLHDLGILVDKKDNVWDIEKSKLTEELDTLVKKAITSLTANTSFQINNIQELEKFIQESTDNRQVFEFLYKYGEIFPTKPFSVEELHTMFSVKDDKLYPTKEYWKEFCRSNKVYRFRNKEKYLKPELIKQIEDPYARAFWELSITHPDQQNRIFDMLLEPSFDYETFTREYINITEEGCFLTEKYYRSIVGDSILYKELSNDSVAGNQHTIGRMFTHIDQKDVDHFKDPKARFFWSLNKLGLDSENHANLQGDLLLETYSQKPDPDNPGEIIYTFDGTFNYDSFVSKFAYELKDENGEITYGLNESFMRYVAKRDQAFLLNNMSLLDDNFMQSVSTPEGKEFWTFVKNCDPSFLPIILSELKEENNPQDYSQFLTNYTHLVESDGISRRVFSEAFIGKIAEYKPEELSSITKRMIPNLDENFINSYVNIYEGEYFLNEEFYETFVINSQLMEESSEREYDSKGIRRADIFLYIDQRDIDKFQDPRAKLFWSIGKQAIRNNRESILSEELLLGTYTGDGRLDYDAFSSRFAYMLKDERGEIVYGLNENIIRHIAIEEPEFLLTNMYLLDDNFIKSINSEESREFWSFSRNCDPSLLGLIFKELGDENNPQEYNQFLINYTHLVESNGIYHRVINEDFIKKIAKSYPNIMSGSAEKILSEETLLGLSGTQRALWTTFKDIKNHRRRQDVISFYNNNEGVTGEQVLSFMNIIEKIENSPSKEMLQVKDGILNSICTPGKTLEEVEREFQLIENIFIRNNSPLALLRSRVFDTLHLKELVEENPYGEISQEFKNILLNPNLTAEGKGRVFSDLLRRDLLNIARDSVDENFYNFINSLRDGMDALTFYDQFILEGYTDEEILSVLGEQEEEYLAKSLDIFFVASEGTSMEKEISARIKELREFLGISQDEPLSTGVYRTYIEPLVDSPTGDIYEDVGIILSEMDSIKQEAHLRGLEYASGKRKIRIEDWDQVKRVWSIEGAIQEGFLAKYFLGMEKDNTPFDTDTIVAQDIDTNATFSEIIRNKNTADPGFGGIILVIKNRGQFKNPHGERTNYPNPRAKYELIPSHFYQGRNYGIRTGFASTEIDFICFDQELFKHKSPEERDRDLQQLKFYIASKGIYIPIVNNQGEIIYTPEEFEQQREVFAGVSGLSGKPFQVQQKTSKITSALEKMTEGLSEDRENVARVSTHIQGAIEAELKERNLTFEDSRTGLEGLRIEHIGSTSRMTHVIGSSDFDFSILLDRNQLRQLSSTERDQLINDIIERIGTLEEPGQTYNMGEDTLQRTGSKVKLESGEVIEFDLAVTDKKGNLDGSNSHEFVIDRLNSIKETQGEEAYRFVVANILYAKKFLKQNQCYKKRQEGGMGGIGIENWILQHHGNFEEAASAFLSAATNPDGSYADFGTFKGRYTVFDPGKDIRSGEHDNFVRNNMTQEGYQRMLNALIAFEKGKVNLD